MSIIQLFAFNVIPHYTMHIDLYVHDTSCNGREPTIFNDLSWLLGESREYAFCNEYI